MTIIILRGLLPADPGRAGGGGHPRRLQPLRVLLAGPAADGAARARHRLGARRRHQLEQLHAAAAGVHRLHVVDAPPRRRSSSRASTPRSTPVSSPTSSWRWFPPSPSTRSPSASSSAASPPAPRRAEPGAPRTYGSHTTAREESHHAQDHPAQTRRSTRGRPGRRRPRHRPHGPGAGPSSRPSRSSPSATAATSAAPPTTPNSPTPPTRGLLGSEFDMITPGNGMKWYATEPQQGVFDWTNGDEIVEPRPRRTTRRSAPTLWSGTASCPTGSPAGEWTANELRAVLKKHIQTEVRHYRGKVYSWDVVNEAFNEDGTYRETIWYKTLGPGYIADALRWAHQADPHGQAVPQRLQHRGGRPEERRLLPAGQGAEGAGTSRSTASASRPIWLSSTAIRPLWRTTSAASPGSASTPRSPRSTSG